MLSDKPKFPKLTTVGSGSSDDGGPNDPVERRFKAADRALHQGNSDLAKALLDRLLQEHPTHFRSLMLQSAIAMAKTQYSKSEMYARAAIKTLPAASVISLDRAVALSQLIDALNRQGKSEEAGVFMRMLGESKDFAECQTEPRASMTTQVASWAKKNILGKGKPESSKQKTEAGNMFKDSAVSAVDGKSKVSKLSAAQIKNMTPSALWSHEEMQERKVVYVGMRQRHVLNAFREVRIRLMQKNKTDNMVVLVSSLKGQGGGSFFAFNLAATFALDPQKTALYVDCNPYDSSAERYVNGVVSFGLSQYLTDEEIDLEQIIYPSGIERMRVIPAAGSNESAAELFNSERMQKFIAEIKERYPDRFIVLDAPSIESTTEARILTQYCDQALLVVPSGKVTQDEVLSGVEALGKQHFAGLVFNH